MDKPPQIDPSNEPVFRKLAEAPAFVEELEWIGPGGIRVPYHRRHDEFYSPSDFNILGYPIHRNRNDY